MPEVIGIRFKPCGKVYDFEINALEVRTGDTVIVESELGLGIGTVVIDSHTVTNAPKELKKILRKATTEDIEQSKENRLLEAESRAYCSEKISEKALQMKLVYTEVALDKKRIVFYFTADGRIDFRDLVKDLAARFKTRIEMRQIGVRDEARAVGGFGMCGRELCCKTFLTSFEPISIKMAKRQDLSLNASKLSGVCGRLMCCLSYEYIERPAAGMKETVDANEVTTDKPAETERPDSGAKTNTAGRIAGPAWKKERNKTFTSQPRHKRTEREGKTEPPKPALRSSLPEQHTERPEPLKTDDSNTGNTVGQEQKTPAGKRTKKNRRRFQR